MIPPSHKSVFDPRGVRGHLGLVAVFAAAFILAQCLGYMSRYGAVSISVIWPPTGVYGVTLALVHRRHWLSILGMMLLIDTLGSLVTSGWSFEQKQIAFLALKSLVNPVTGVVFALIVRHGMPGGDPLCGPREFFIYVFVAIGFNVLVVSLVGWLLVALLLGVEDVIPKWQQWSYSDMTALLTFATPALVLSHRPELLRRPDRRTGEAALVLVLFTLACTILFANNHDENPWIQHYQLIVLLPIFAWVVARFGPVMMTVMTSVLALAVLLGLASGLGPFDSEGRPDAENVLVAQGLLVPGMLGLLYISSLLEGRRRQFEQDLRTEQRMRRLDRTETIGTMAAGVAHDFGNLAIAIRAYQATLRAQVKDPSGAVREAITGLGEIADGTQSLTRSLMNFARDEDDEAETGSAVTDLCVSVHACVAALSPLMGRAHPLRVDVPDEPVFVRATRGDLQRTLTNLVVNAGDASPTGSRIEIGVRRDDGDALLTIADHGKGIPPEVLVRVMDPFYTTKPRGKGTGLGLSVVAGVVRDMGGTIDIDSAVGQGTTVTIRVPIVDPPLGSATGHASGAVS